MTCELLDIKSTHYIIISEFNVCSLYVSVTITR